MRSVKSYDAVFVGCMIATPCGDLFADIRIGGKEVIKSFANVVRDVTRSVDVFIQHQGLAQFGFKERACVR